MAVALVDDERAVDFRRARAELQLAGLRAEAHRAAFFGDLALLVEHRDDRMRRVQIKFGRVRLGQLQHVARELNRRDLHSKAKAEVRDFIFARVLGRENFPFHAAFAKPARH